MEATATINPTEEVTMSTAITLTDVAQELLHYLQKCESSEERSVRYWEGEVQRLIDLSDELDCSKLLRATNAKVVKCKSHRALATQRVQALQTLLAGGKRID